MSSEKRGPGMTIRTAGESQLKRAGHAVLSAASGLLLGVVTYALAATTRVMLDPGVAAGGQAGAWIVGAALVFAGALFWALMGGALLVLPLVSIVFVFLALRAGPEAVRPGRRALLGTGLWSVLFGALLASGSSGGAIDAGLLGIAIALGVAFGVGRLGRMQAA